jgi:hypothetical protein
LSLVRNLIRKISENISEVCVTIGIHNFVVLGLLQTGIRGGVGPRRNSREGWGGLREVLVAMMQCPQNPKGCVIVGSKL